MLNTAIDVTGERIATIQDVARRSLLVSARTSDEPRDALITDDGAAALAAVRQGQHALVLDPFVLSAEIQGELQSSRLAMAGMCARYHPGVRALWNSHAAGNLGEPGLLRIHRWGEAAVAVRAAMMSQLDLAIWILGDRPSEIYGVERPEFLQAHLGFPGGGMALIDLDGSIPSADAYYSVSLIGSTGAAYADDHRNMNLLIDPDRTRAVRVAEGQTGLLELLDEFSKAVQDGTDLSSSWVGATETQRTAQALDQSVRESKVTTLGANHG